MTILKVNEVEVLSLDKPKPKIEKVLKMYGYKDPDRVRRAVRAAAQSAIEGFIHSTQPSISYRIIKISKLTENTLTLHHGIDLTSPIFHRYLAGAKQAVVFALTVGEQIDELASDWMENDRLVEAMFLESAAWLGVEDVTKQFVLILRTWAKAAGFRITRRLGPGYSYRIDGQKFQWDLHDQAGLFQCFESVEIPVSILESAAMLPKMSRSGMFGLIDRSTDDTVHTG